MSPIKVLVTGAAGQIAYSLLPIVARGDVFGAKQKIILHLLDIAPMIEAVKGVAMELQDCSFPLLSAVISTSDETEAFTDIDYAFLVGAMPRKEGMERKDLLTANGKIFVSQGNALDRLAKKTVKVLVVGNPANTNCMTAAKNAPSIPAANFSAMTRLDLNRAHAQIAARVGVACDAVEKCIIWGNHSNTQYPDATHGLVTVSGKKQPIPAVVQDDQWLQNDFIKCVQSRGAAIIKARKLSSAMSAAKAACDHMRDWFQGTNGGWVSMGIISDGSYGVPEGLCYSYPVTIDASGKVSIVQGLEISDFARQKMDTTAKELEDERSVMSNL